LKGKPIIDVYEYIVCRDDKFFGHTTGSSIKLEVGDQVKVKKIDNGLLKVVGKAEDWCVAEGGKWITYRGKHICIGVETDDPGREGYKVVNVLHDKYNKTRLHYSEDVDSEVVNKIKSGLQHYPVKVRADVNDVWVHNSTINDCVVGANLWQMGLIELGDVRFVDTEGTFHHEMGHSIWNRQFKTSDHLDWRLVGGEPISLYGRTSAQEDFCESLKMYKTDPKLLHRMSGERYMLIKKQLEELEK